MACPRGNRHQESTPHPRPVPALAVRAEPPCPSQPIPSSSLPAACRRRPPSGFRVHPCQGDKEVFGSFETAIFRPVSTQRTPLLEDVEARKPSTHVSLTRVGVKGVQQVIRIRANGNEPELY